MKKILLMIVSILLLQACNLAQRPEEPSIGDVSLEGETLIWDEVEGALYYTLIFNGVIERIAYTNQFELINLPNGEYTVLIKAHFDEGDPVSKTKEFSLERTFDHPRNVSLSASLVLSFTAPDNVIDYTISVNGDTFQTDEMSMDLSDILTGALFYEIKVKAHYLAGDSLYSNRVFHLDDDVETTVLQSDFNLLLQRDFTMPFDLMDDILYIYDGNTVFPQSAFSYEPTLLTIHHMALSVYDEGEKTLYMIGGDVIIELILDLHESQTPYMISSNSVMFDGNDLVFMFELFGGSFKELTGNDITSDDYTFINDQLTISHLFIDDILADNPDRSTVIVSYILETTEDDIVIGYIFINIP